MNDNFQINRRSFFRVELLLPLCGEICILSINNKEISSQPSPICISNIGAGGVGFKSSLDLPVNNNIKYNVQVLLFNEIYNFTTILMWKSKTNNNSFLYGGKFILDSSKTETFVFLFNKLMVSTKKASNTSYKVCNMKRCPNIISRKRKTV